MFPLEPAFKGLDAVVPEVTFPNASVTLPLASGVFPFTFCTAAVTSVTGIFDIVEKGLVPLPIIYPVKEVDPDPPLATATVPVTLVAVPLVF